MPTRNEKRADSQIWLLVVVAQWAFFADAAALYGTIRSDHLSESSGVSILAVERRSGDVDLRLDRVIARSDGDPQRLVSHDVFGRNDAGR